MDRGERLNATTHLIGAVAAAVGQIVLVVGAARQGDPWKIVSVSIYGSSLTLLFLFSTLYHSLRGTPKRVFQKLDHSAIYLLIAGTYTPFALVTLRGPWGWTLFGINWGLALIGIAQDLLYRKNRKEILSVALYVLMGWLIVVAARPLTEALSPSALAWGAAGGLFYTGGIIFYALSKRVRYAHGIWHLCVLGGAACHYWVILRYVL